jgi:hypothetical protein
MLGNLPELVFGEEPFQIVGFQLDLSQNSHVPSLRWLVREPFMVRRRRIPIPSRSPSMGAPLSSTLRSEAPVFSENWGDSNGVLDVVALLEY